MLPNRVILSIGETGFSGKLNYNDVDHDQLMQQMVDELKKLPEPQILGLEYAFLNEENIAMALQSEKAYVDKFSNLPILYLGSLNVAQCIFGYMYTETDHLAFHVDSSLSDLELTEDLLNFNYRNIKVVLAGGLPDKNSQTNIRIILKSLYKASEILQKEGIDISIQIVKQKIIERNLAKTDEEFFDHYYTLVMKHAGEVSKKLYGRSLSINALKESYAIDKRTAPEEVYFAYIESISNIKNITLTPAQEKRYALFKNMFPTHLSFEKGLKASLNKESLKIQAKDYKDQKRMLLNFAIDLEKHTIHVIPYCLKTPFQNNRNMTSIDSFKEKKCVRIYDGRNDLYFNKPLSPDFIRECK